MIPRTTPPFERIKCPAVRAISLTSATLPTRTCDVLIVGGERGVGIFGERGGAYDCYHLI